MSESMTLAELSQESGVPARTIRFYITRGLLNGPVKAGRGAEYTAGHLARLEKIRKLQSEGRMLSEIVYALAPEQSPEQSSEQSAGDSAATARPPSAWWQHVVHDDVMVWVRGDVSPWRMKQIRAAVEGMAAQLGRPDNDNQRSKRK